MQPYISLLKGDIEEVVRILRDIIRKREEDIEEFDNIPEVQVSGRSVNRVPVNSTDIVPSDRAGDIAFTNDSIYAAIEVTPGVVEWRKSALVTF